MKSHKRGRKKSVQLVPPTIKIASTDIAGAFLAVSILLETNDTEKAKDLVDRLLTELSDSLSATYSPTIYNKECSMYAYRCLTSNGIEL